MTTGPSLQLLLRLIFYKTMIDKLSMFKTYVLLFMCHPLFMWNVCVRDLHCQPVRCQLTNILVDMDNC